MSSTGTKRGNSRGTARSSRADQTYKKTTKNSQKISKYFTKSAKDEQLSDSPYKNCLNEVKGVKLDSSMSDFDDFSTPKAINKVSKISAKPPEKNARKKRTRQAPLKKFIEDNLKHCDVNPEHLQMALALSESSYEAENPLLSSQEKKESFKKAFEQFGFGYSKSRITVQSKKPPLEPKRKKSRFRYVTPILKIRTSEERDALISSKVSLILTENSRKSAHAPPPISEFFTDSLQKYSSRKLFKMHNLELDELNTGDLFYVRGLGVEKCSASCGALLKDWRKIQGRDPTPERDAICEKIDDSVVVDDDGGRGLAVGGGALAENIPIDEPPMSCSVTGNNIKDNLIFSKEEELKEEIKEEREERQKPSKYRLSPTINSLQIEEELSSDSITSLKSYDEKICSKDEKKSSFKYEHINLCSSDEDPVKDTETQDKTLEYTFSHQMTPPSGFNLFQNKNLLESQKSPKPKLVTSPIMEGEFSTNGKTSFIVNSPTIENFLVTKIESPRDFIAQDQSAFLENDFSSSNKTSLDYRLSLEISSPLRVTPPRDTKSNAPHRSPRKRSFSCLSPDLFGSDEEMSSPVTRLRGGQCLEEVECYDLTQSDQEESFHLISGPEDSIDRRSDLNVTDYVKNLLSGAPARQMENISTSDDDSQPSQSTVCISDDELNYSSVFSAPNQNDDTPSPIVEKLQESMVSPKRNTPKRLPLSNISPSKIPPPANLEDSFNHVLGHLPVDTPSTSTSSFVIKTKNVTPMANYDAMDTPKIAKELDKFGLKPLRRQKGAKLLKYIYEATHPVVDENTHAGKKRRTQEPQIGDIIVGDISENDVILEKKQSKRIPSCAVPLHIAWHNLVMCNPKIRENILLYEPLQLEVLHSMLKDQGFKFNIQDLLAFLDKKCITIRTAQGQHHGKKRR